jgi:hypothetical protein
VICEAPRVRALRLSSLAAALVVAAVAGAVSTRSDAATPRLQAPDRAEIANAPSAIPDSSLSAGAAHRLLAQPSTWGGSFVAASGETLTILVSDTYPMDPATAQRWADFLGTLVHGPELSRLTAYLLTTNEVESLCGDEALACYSANREILVAPGEDPDADVSAEAVVTHEYGHHVAANRSNAPWRAIDWGTKRWATDEHVCGRTRAGELHPGAEDVPDYRSNPGEGFAESYRVLNQRKLGLPETPWFVVSQSLFPDETALGKLEQDVVQPWTKRTTSVVRGTLRGRATSRSFTISTPLDGRLTLTLRSPAGARFSFGLTQAGRRVAASASSATTTVCGQRSYRVQVRSVKGAGTFQLTVAKP